MVRKNRESAFAFDTDHTHTHSETFSYQMCLKLATRSFLFLLVLLVFFVLIHLSCSICHWYHHSRQWHSPPSPSPPTFRSQTLHIKSSQVKSQIITIHYVEHCIVLVHIQRQYSTSCTRTERNIQASYDKQHMYSFVHIASVLHDGTNRHEAITISIIMIMIMKIIQFKVI